MASLEGSESEFQSLEDFDWSVKLVLASSSLSSMQKPLLQLQMTTAGPEGLQDSIIELDSEELDALLQTCEQIRGSTREMP
mmetsp:Transcript_13964/g.52148  ORF Transcript_13964/g.52148 Transcript_13964/m.52148 type:complete len:81 (+) Transcript_13964:85-327(+)